MRLSFFGLPGLSGRRLRKSACRVGVIRGASSCYASTTLGQATKHGPTVVALCLRPCNMARMHDMCMCAHLLVAKIETVAVPFGCGPMRGRRARAPSRLPAPPRPP